jgi:hypothetical protein
MPRAGGSRGNAPKRVFNGVAWVGMDEFRRDLAAYGRSVPKILAQANHEVGQLGVERAQQAAREEGSTAAHVAPSIRANASARQVAISLGNNAFPMALGAEFGAKHDIPRTVKRAGRSTTVRGWNQFEPWVGNQYEKGASDEGGYFMGPALRAAEPEMLALYARLLDEIERTVFNDK